MIFVELALQGLKGFPPLVRMGLRSGLNVWRCSDPALRSALVDAVYHTLFPDPARGSATAHLTGGDPSRIALTFFGRDKITYRLVRDVENGATKLYRFDAPTNQYQLFTNVAQEAAQYIRVQQRIPDEVGYERLFLFSRETVPSKGGKARSRSGAPIVAGFDRGPSGPGMPASEGPLFGAPPRMMSSSSLPATAMPRGASGFGTSMNMNNALVRSEMESMDLGRGLVPETSSDLAPSPLPSPSSSPSPSPSTSRLGEREIAEKSRQLIELRKAHQAAIRAEQAQVELDQLNLRRFELTEKAERVKKIEAERARLVEHFDHDADLRSLPPNFAQRIERFEELKLKHDLERVRAYEELSAAERDDHSLSLVGLHQDPYFIGGVVGVIAVFALALYFGIPSLVWLNLLSMAVAAGGAFRYVGELEQQHQQNIRLRTARDRLDRIDRSFVEDTRAANDLMVKLGIDSPQQLLERLRGHEKLQSQIRVADEAIKVLLTDREIQIARTEIDQITLRVEVLESEVLGASSVVSADTLAKRVRALESDLGPHAPPPEGLRPVLLRRASSSFFPPPSVLPRSDSLASIDIPKVPPFTESGQTTPADPRVRGVSKMRPIDPADDDDDGPGYGLGRGSSGRGPSRGGGAGFSMVGFGGSSGGFPGGGGGRGYGYGDDSSGASPAADRSRALFQVAVDLMAVEVDDLAARIGVRLGQYLSAFTDKQIREGRFGPRGELTVVSTDDEATPYAELPPELADMVDAALRFTLVEACLTKVRIPVLFDDPFTKFSAKKRKLLEQMLGYLASTTQVFMMTDRADPTGHEVML